MKYMLVDIFALSICGFYLALKAGKKFEKQCKSNLAYLAMKTTIKNLVSAFLNTLVAFSLGFAQSLWLAFGLG
ncbi:hypothetical protein [Legionella impletisoli]|uniref:hypothetical protein n=1 Tax=Legionella impletisoli TaxID=343510 RepID=UPI001040E82F|nr:hypothetical protein [Legionella impletisoli]